MEATLVYWGYTGRETSANIKITELSPSEAGQDLRSPISPKP